MDVTFSSLRFMQSYYSAACSLVLRGFSFLMVTGGNLEGGNLDVFGLALIKRMVSSQGFALDSSS
jgi:hypothetical protein